MKTSNDKPRNKAFQAVQSSNQTLNNSQFASQKSIVPSKKKIQTIAFDASPHQFDWGKSMVENNIPSAIDPPLTRLAKKKSSTLSIRDIKADTQKQGEEIFKNSQNISQSYVNNLNSMYGFGNDEDNSNNAYDINVDALFLNHNNSNSLFRGNSRIMKSIPRRANIPFNKTFSGFSGISNSGDLGDNKTKDLQNDNQNLFKNLQSSLGFVKIPTQDLNNIDIDENKINDIPDIPLINSRDNSFQNLLKNDHTPALFRGGSSIIDSRILKKHN